MFKPALWGCLKSYDRQTLIHDLIAGATVGVVALPLAMAFAIACDMPPERGLYTAIVAGLLISALGGSRLQIGGPTGAFVVIVAGISAKYGYEGLVLCTLLAGGLLIALGVFRMGALIRFIPFPVVTGFTTGIAVVIFTTQIPDLLGLRIDEAATTFVGRWLTYGRHLATLKPEAVAVSVLTIGTILLTRRYRPHMPALLVAMVAATLASLAFGLDIETIGGRFGELPRSLPRPSMPVISFETIPELISPALTIGLLAAIESLLSATVADGMTGDRHLPNTELIAQGVANIGSALFGGIPATGAIARTATNIRAGARTPVAGIVHAVVLLLVLALCAPLAAAVPLSALSGILVVICVDMAQLDHFLGMLKAPRSDVMVQLTTFSLTMLIDLTVAVQVGVVLSALLFMRRMAEVTNVGMITREFREGGREGPDLNSIALRDVPDDVEIFEIDGPFFFGAADQFRETMSVLERPPAVVILRLRAVPAIDGTGLHVLDDFHAKCRRDGTHLILSGVHAQPLVAMTNHGLVDEIGIENMLTNIDDALNRARELLGLPPVSRPVPFEPSVTRDQPTEAN